MRVCGIELHTFGRARPRFAQDRKFQMPRSVPSWSGNGLLVRLSGAAAAWRAQAGQGMPVPLSWPLSLTLDSSTDTTQRFVTPDPRIQSWMHMRNPSNIVALCDHLHRWRNAALFSWLTLLARGQAFFPAANARKRCRLTECQTRLTQPGSGVGKSKSSFECLGVWDGIGV